MAPAYTKAGAGPVLASLLLLLGCARAQIWHVYKNQADPVVVNVDYPTRDATVYVSGPQMKYDGPAPGVKCWAHTGSVPRYGAAWQALQDIACSYSHDAELEDVYTCPVSVVGGYGFGEYKVWCQLNGGNKVWSEQKANRRIVVEPACSSDANQATCNSGCAYCESLNKCVGSGTANQQSFCPTCPIAQQYSAAAGACQACPAGTWSTGGTSSCSACPISPACTACDPASGLCTACAPGNSFNPVTGTCSPCPDGFWGNGTGSCSLCTIQSPCGACDKSTGACSSCPAGMELPSTGCSLCKAGHYKNASGAGECATVNAVANCALYDPVWGNCSRCQNMYNLSAAGCTECPNGTYSEGVLCMKSCGEGCSNCSQSECARCMPGYARSKACFKCPALQFSTDGLSPSCSKCTLADNCVQCDSTTGSCSACSSGWGLYGNTCRNCSEGQFSSGTAPCAECTVSHCVKCDRVTGGCNRCEPGFGLTAAYTCQACAGALYSSDGKNCRDVVAVADCAEYNHTDGRCARCRAHYGLSPLGNSCSRCSDMQFSDGSSQCTQCHLEDSCQMCGWSAQSCARCSAGYGLNASSHCALCPPGTHSTPDANSSCVACTKDAQCRKCDTITGLCSQCIDEWAPNMGQCQPCQCKGTRRHCDGCFCSEGSTSDKLGGCIAADATVTIKVNTTNTTANATAHTVVGNLISVTPGVPMALDTVTPTDGGALVTVIIRDSNATDGRTPTQAGLDVSQTVIDPTSDLYKKPGSDAIDYKYNPIVRIVVRRVATSSVWEDSQPTPAGSVNASGAHSPLALPLLSSLVLLLLLWRAQP
eukprot:m51a1_g4494 putative protein serine threonine (820) ;mRNA; f:329948-333632